MIWMAWSYYIIVTRRGRALLCPLNPPIESGYWYHPLTPDKTDVICIGRSRTPPLRDTIIYYILTNNKYGNSEKQKLESIEK